MKILGIDPGTARMGYGVLHIEKDSKAKVLEVDTLITHQDLAMPKRLKFIHERLKSIIDTHEPDIMVIEKLFFNTNVKTAIAVGQARGVALLASAHKDILLYEYTALEAKKVLTGYGRASKTEMQEAVKEMLELDNIIKSDDANDSLAMALCFIKKDLENLWSDY